MNILNKKELNKDETKKQLLNLRKKLINTIYDYDLKSYLKKEDLKELNEHICSVYNHDFDIWTEKADSEITYYERECKICGIKEIIDYKPDKYKVLKK